LKKKVYLYNWFFSY